MTVDQKLVGITTLIKSKSSTYGYSSQGSGFFYSELAEKPTGPINEEKHIGWYQVKGQWLITNRHVVLVKTTLPDGREVETLPYTFEFYLREVVNGQIEWFPISLSQEELRPRIILHPNNEIDIAAIKIDDIITTILRENQSKHIISPISLTNRDLPENFPGRIEATSDIIVCSYPHGSYDQANKFPIIKSGIIASSWNSYFNGKPFFLIDAQLFPGSSGGLVLSKPIDIALIDGQLKRSDEKQFSILGVYSGGFVHQEIDKDGNKQSEHFGLGIVWYSRLITEIVRGGVSLS